MNISIVGTGYVGLVTGACFAKLGNNVICLDIDEKKVEKINNGISPIYEAGLNEILSKYNKRIKATTNYQSALKNSDITFICVGTPSKKDGSIDLSFVNKSVIEIGRYLKEKNSWHLIVVKSTVLPGSSINVILPLLEKHSGKKAGKHFGIAMNPEFLREGEAINDFLNPDRIVIGVNDGKSCDALRKLYKDFSCPIVETTLSAAEMIKYASNAFLATKISYINEMSNLCEILGADIHDVAKGMGLDNRIGRKFLHAGPGYGGSCFPKDVKALIAHGKTIGNPMQLLDAVIKVNQLQPNQILTRLKKHFPILRDVQVAVLGLAFKPGTDDMRESPAIPIIKQLTKEHAKIKAFDPVATASARKLFAGDAIQYCETILETVDQVEVILLLTRWEEFAVLPDILKKLDHPPLLIDGRRMLDKDKILRYEGIGL